MNRTICLLQLRGETITNLRKNIKLGLLAGSFIVLAALLLTYRHAIAQRMDEWQLLPRSEHLTELFFTNYQTMPAHIDTDRAYDLAFTIRNREHTAMTYHYHIVASAGDADIHQTLEEGTLTLAADESHNLTPHVAIPVLGERTKVQVIVDFTGTAFGETTARQQMQSIHFWATARPEANHDNQ